MYSNPKTAEAECSFPECPTSTNVAAWICQHFATITGDISSDHGGCRFQMPHVLFDLTGRTAGRAFPSRHEIHLNRQLFEHTADHYRELRDTAAHELAHLLVHHLAPNEPPHGDIWRSFAMRLGGSGERTHNIPLKRARRSTVYLYDLPQAGVVRLGAIRHKRVQGGEVSSYIWRATREKITAKAYTGRSEVLA